MRSIRSAADIVALTNEWGFLPFFENGIPGFSVEELTPKELWFASDVDGPWEWKGPVIRASGCAYGKFFGGKAVFISREWFLDFAKPSSQRASKSYPSSGPSAMAPCSPRTPISVPECPSRMCRIWRRGRRRPSWRRKPPPSPTAISNSMAETCSRSRDGLTDRASFPLRIRR